MKLIPIAKVDLMQFPVHGALRCRFFSFFVKFFALKNRLANKIFPQKQKNTRAAQLVPSHPAKSPSSLPIRGGVLASVGRSGGFSVLLRTGCLAGLLLVLALSLAAQKPAPPKPKDLKKSGDQYFQQREYLEAVPYYLKYQLAEPQDFMLKYNIGVSYFYLDSIDRAMAYFRYVLQKEDTPNEVYRYLARCQVNKGQYENAAKYLKLYLSTLDERSSERSAVKTNILQYLNAQYARAQPTSNLVENLGGIINTRYDEFLPLFHPEEPNAVYFASRRQGNFGEPKCPNGPGPIGDCYRADVFRAELVRGQWSTPNAAIFGLNSPAEELLFGFGGKKHTTAYFFRGKDFVKGDWYAAEIFDRRMPDTLSPMLPPFNALGVFEGSVAPSGSNIIVFASERPGGYGGRDLWFSRRYPDGSWLDPQNLGPVVNSPFNEDCPFLSPDGRTLYFSSDNAESHGGYDIYRAVFSDSLGDFFPPENLGYPINSPADDRDFHLGTQAATGFFASNRTGGHGGFDLYEAYFRPVRPGQEKPLDPPTFVDVLLPPLPPMPEPAPEPAPKPVPPPVVIKPGDPRVKPLPPNPTPPPVVPVTLPDPPVPTPDPLPADAVVTDYSPIYYDKKTAIINPASFQTIEQISRFAEQYPNAQLVVVAHTDSSTEALGRDVFLAFKQAELVARKLVELGVNKNNILLQGVGPFYPLSRYQAPDGQRNMMAGLMNCRVEVWCRNAGPGSEKVVLACRHPEIVAQFRDTRANTYSGLTAGLHYRIQLGAISGEYKDAALTRYPSAFAESAYGAANIRYCTGLFFRFADAKTQVDRLRLEGYKDAFVVAYHKDIRLTKPQVEALLPRFPDLAAYALYKKELGE